LLAEFSHELQCRVGIALERTLNDRPQRVVVIGSGHFLANQYVGLVGNMDLGINIINWLAGDENLITVQPKGTLDSSLTLNRTSMMVIVYGFLVLLPWAAATLAMPALVLGMFLLAVPFALRLSRQGGVGQLIVVGIVAGFLFYVFNNLVGAMGLSGTLDVALAAWMPALIATLLGVALLLSRHSSRPRRRLEVKRALALPPFRRRGSCPSPCKRKEPPRHAPLPLRMSLGRPSRRLKVMIRRLMRRVPPRPLL
jgi:hypothetical protein